MNHFNPILNKYNTVKKKLKAKVTERKKLNVQKDKTSILNPIQHIKLNQQLTTVTEEIEELKSRKEQLIFQAQWANKANLAMLSERIGIFCDNTRDVIFQSLGDSNAPVH